MSEAAERTASDFVLQVGDVVDVFENGVWERVTVFRLFEDWGFGFENSTIECGCRRRDQTLIRKVDDDGPRGK